METEQESDSVETYDKTYRVYGYFKDAIVDAHDGDMRSMIDKIDDSRDYMKKKEVETTEYKLVVNGEEIPIDEEQYNNIVESDLGDADAVEETHHNEEFEIPKGLWTADMLDSFVNGIEFDIPLHEDVEVDVFNTARDTDGNTVLSFGKSTSRSKVLKPYEEMDPKDPYVGEERIPSIQFRVRVKDQPDGVHEYAENELVPEMVEFMKEIPSIGRIRVGKCVEETSYRCIRA